MVRKELLEILCCPVCKRSLTYEPEKNTLTCTSCGKTYRVDGDIPVMLPDEKTTS